MTEDAPGAAPQKMIAQSNILEISCAAGCGRTDRVPAYADKVDKKLRPVAVYPYICLACWRVGYRSRGPLGGSHDFEVYKCP